MKILYIGIIAAIAIFFGIQTIAPFPYGLVIGIGVAGLIIWKAAKSVSLDRDSLLHYRRAERQLGLLKRYFWKGKYLKKNSKRKKRNSI